MSNAIYDYPSAQIDNMPVDTGTALGFLRDELKRLYQVEAVHLAGGKPDEPELVRIRGKLGEYHGETRRLQNALGIIARDTTHTADELRDMARMALEGK